MKNLTSIETQKDHRETTGKFKRFLAGSLAAAALLSSPMLERAAYAQTPSPEAQSQTVVQPQNAPARRSVRYDVNGSQSYTLNNGDSSISAYIVMNDGSISPQISFEGPATMSIRFYPLVRPADVQNDATVPLSVSYAVDSGSPVPQSFTSGSSAVTQPTLAARGLAIGTPKDLTIEVSGEGRHQVTVSSASGFVEVVSVLAPQAVEQPVQRPVEPPRPPVQVQPPVQAPEANAGRQLDSIRSRLSLNYDSYWFRSFGNGRSSGSIHELDVLYRHPLGEHLALMVGPHLSLYDSGIETAGARTNLLSGDFTAMAGLAAYFGDHTIYLAGFGGLQLLSYDVSAADGRNGSGTPLGGAYGGRIGYDYNDILGLQAQLSNNPFNPGSVRLHFALPYTWIRGNPVRPTIDASLLWLHLMRPGTDGVGGASLAEDNLFLHAHALLPIWRLGPVVPSALVGFEYDRSLNGAGPADKAAALLGGALTVDIADRFRLMAGAGASVPDGSPFILVNANLLR